MRSTLTIYHRCEASTLLWRRCSAKVTGPEFQQAKFDFLSIRGAVCAMMKGMSEREGEIVFPRKEDQFNWRTIVSKLFKGR